MGPSRASRRRSSNMRRSDRGLARASKWLSRAGGVMLLLAALLVSVEVIARKLLLLPFNAGTELAMYSLAVGASFAFANTLLEKAHVRIDIIHRLLPQEGRVVLDL